MAFAGAAMAHGTPDDVPPSRESACIGLSGAAFGLCNAFCQAQDCDTHPRPSCDQLRANFRRVTGNSVFPCERPAPTPTSTPSSELCQPGATCVCSSGRTCATDADCPGGEFCRQGLCIGSLSCTSNSECRAFEQCIPVVAPPTASATVPPPTQTETPAPPTETATPVATASPPPPTATASPSPSPAAPVCGNGILEPPEECETNPPTQCVEPTTGTVGVCGSDCRCEFCRAGEFCVCTAGLTCTTSADCPAGETCLANPSTGQMVCVGQLGCSSNSGCQSFEHCFPVVAAPTATPTPAG